MVNVDSYSAIITKVSNALNTLVSGEKPGFQTLSEGFVVLLCAEVVRQRVPDHGAVHSECRNPVRGPAGITGYCRNMRLSAIMLALKLCVQYCSL